MTIHEIPKTFRENRKNLFGAQIVRLVVEIKNFHFSFLYEKKAEGRIRVERVLRIYCSLPVLAVLFLIYDAIHF